MLISGTPTRTIRRLDDAVEIIDQTRLPYEWTLKRLVTLGDAAEAIAVMRVRGAPLIGATAAYGLVLAALEDAGDAALRTAADRLIATRPTAVNLHWAVQRMLARLLPLPLAGRVEAAWAEASAICEEDVAQNRAIGQHGLELLRAIGAKKAGPINILTHCNAGWLATVDWGTALAPIYAAAEAGLDVHVWVDETRPRNQGASLTAWELGQAGIAHRVIADNAGGHLMQHGKVDICIVGTDRVAANGDVANKIGTYLKALAAFDNGVPFYVAAPGPSIDFNLADGGEIPIEERDPEEVACIQGRAADGQVVSVRLTPAGSAAANPAFDVTPARLITGFITERGVCGAGRAALATMFADRAGVRSR
ncbi:MAG: S-methyl-5-thioribose-1-phosphate isomerase [Hydrogenophilales bacterium 28-61-23]|nr:MAG: S-methyl-5-thioribose-1-phosphate isomerase [Hydrogenophilales bacterium 28-61-23]